MKLALAAAVMRDTAQVTGFSDKRWELLLRQLRASNLSASFFERLKRLGLEDAVPASLRWHFTAAEKTCSRHRQAVEWEVEELQRALGRRGIPVVLLKGAAYVMAGLEAGRGRLFFDIDILVPEHALSDAEGILRKFGWAPTHLNDYDQRFYRDWSHELPPMQHRLRGTTLDIHHTIIPPTAKPKPDPRKLLADARPVAGYEEIYTLAPVDMVLHSAVHLFHDGELEHGLRDLVDLDNLMREFAQTPGFWDALLRRATQQQLSRPLFYALRYAATLLGSDIPAAVLKASEQASPGPIGKRWMDALFLRALQPDHATCDDALTGFARWGLYVRSHYLRMPLRLLIPHLTYKALFAKRAEERRQREVREAREQLQHVAGRQRP